MRPILYLFLDTNVLVQCKPLEELDWLKWREFDEIQLIISRPVQSEFDDQKNKGNDRLARRARRASSLLKEIITSDHGHKLIRDLNPTVKVSVRLDLRPEPSLSNDLDYDHADDRLVGIVKAFAAVERHPAPRLLTHDVGPMASARAVGVTIESVPDDWLLPPEPSEADKRIRLLEAEVASLKENEPKITVDCTGPDGQKVDKLEFEVPIYEALSTVEISNLVQRLMERFPVEVVPRTHSHGLSLSGIARGFIPPTNEQLVEYREKYDKWLKRTQEVLQNLHGALQEAAAMRSFTFRLTNSGSRPANDVLVTVRSHGGFEIAPKNPIDAERADGGERRQSVQLPKPPALPTGRIPGYEPIERTYADSLRASILKPIAFPLELRPPAPRDRNKFYQKRGSEMAEEFTFECSQWRHRIEPETIEGSILFPRNEVKDIDGLIACAIRAENLKHVMEWRVPVAIRAVPTKTFPTAAKMVERSDGFLN